MAQLRFGPFRLDSAERRLHGGAAVIPLRPKTFAVLEHLATRPGRLVTKEQLLAAVWPDTAVSDAVLKVCVREIRDALGDNPDDPRYVETAHRLGYRFIGQAPVTNLPAPVSSLVGREREIAEISSALESCRLLTLVGAGGSGKSRLALEVAASLRDRFEDGVWWVDLAAVTYEGFVPQAIAVTLGLRDQPGEPLPVVLARYLSTRAVLLVADNCEHLLSGTASLIQELLPAAPRLRVLATSREPLKTEGEQLYWVPTLSIPESASLLTPSQALEYQAVRLFEVRARAALPTFVISERNSPAVVDICRQLDGLPLAIELAAARVAAIPVEEIAARLGDSLRVLGSGTRSASARHHTLRAAIDWSYERLEDAERQLLDRLSVFADRFTLDAAEHVGRHADRQPGEGFDVINRLIDKSLVFVAERPESSEWRYRLLETVRQYAHEKLRAAEDETDVGARYIEYYRTLAEAMEPRINTAERQARLDALEREHGNLRGAIERATHAGQDGEAARIATALFWFWFHRGHWREGRKFLGAVLEREIAPSRIRARALLGDGVLAWAEGALAAAAARLEECVTLGQRLRDASATAHALHFLAMVRLAEGNGAAGRPLAEAAVRQARRADDGFCLAITLASHGVVLLALEEYDEATAALRESVERGRQIGDAWAIALPLRNLAIIACRRGEYKEAQQLLEESLRGLRHLSEKWFLSRSIETLAEVLATAGDHERSASLFGAAESLREAVGAPVLAFYKRDYDGAVASVRQALGPQVFERCWRFGLGLSPEQMIEYALGEDSATPTCRA